METSFKLLSFVLVFAIMIGCSQENPVSDPENKRIPIDLPEMSGVDIRYKTAPVIQGSSWTGSVIYDFDDLSNDCTWDNVFPNTYKDLVFPGSPHIARCQDVNIPGIQNINLLPADSKLNSSGGLGIVRIELPMPASKVQIYSANIKRYKPSSSLISYDENGDQIESDSNTEHYYNKSKGAFTSVLLTVGENNETPIHSIGLRSHQIATYFDNLEILYGPIDTTPPEISYTQNETNLWPVNHKMILAVSGISIIDDYDENPTLSIAISSNEEGNVHRIGNTSTDWEIVENNEGSFDVYLRAERSGQNSGRMYTITISAEDEAGNTSEEVLEVTVEHDKGRG